MFWNKRNLSMKMIERVCESEAKIKCDNIKRKKEIIVDWEVKITDLDGNEKKICWKDWIFYLNQMYDIEPTSEIHKYWVDLYDKAKEAYRWTDFYPLFYY